MSLSKEINAITECSICTEPFIDPRFLPCLHTFCLKCLKSYGDSRKSDDGLTCPLCRAKFDVPLNALSDLPVNFFILKLLDINKVVDAPNKNVSCDACSGLHDDEDETDELPPSSETATVYCFDCRQSLCKKCAHIHKKLRYNRSHLVVELGKKQSDELLRMSQTYCDAHQDEVVKTYCSDCQKSICMLCYVENHSTHKCCSVSKVAEEFLQQLQEDIARVSVHMEKCLMEEKRLLAKKDEFLLLLKRKYTLVHEMVNELHESLDAHAERILADLASIRQVKLKEFEAAESEIQGLQVTMDSFKRYGQEVITKATPADVACIGTMLKKRAGELNAMCLEVDVPMVDVDVTSLNLKHLFTNQDVNKVDNLMVYSSRKDNSNDYGLAENSTIHITQVQKSNMIAGVTSIGNRLYLLHSSKSTEKQIMGTCVLKLQIPDTFNLNNTVYNRASYTECNFALWHLQLRYTSGENRLQLMISSAKLVEDDGVIANPISFDLDPNKIGQPSNVTKTIAIQSPQKLYNLGFYGMNITFSISASSTQLTVQASFSNFDQNTGYEVDGTIDIPITGNPILPRFYALDMYDLKPEQGLEIPKCERDLHSSVIQLKLPDTFTDNTGASHNLTSYTTCDSILLYLEMVPAESPDCQQLKISNPILSEALNNVSSTTLFSIQGFLEISPVSVNETITLGASQTIRGKGIYGFKLGVKVSGTTENIAVDISFVGVNITNTNSPTESTIKIDVLTSVKPGRKLSTVLLPLVDPTDLASCSYYQCFYIGDRLRSSILRVDSRVQTSIWPVQDVPDGLSIPSNHNVVVSCSQARRIKEFTTFGVLLRNLSIAESVSPLHCVEWSTGKYLVATGCGIYLASVDELTNRGREEVGSYDDEPKGSQKDTATDDDTKNTQEETENVMESDTSVLVDGKEHGKEGLPSVAIEKLQILGDGENGPVRFCIDQFGFVFVLTETKVHLLSPSLKYVRELITLDALGAKKPRYIHFHPESGFLYLVAGEGSSQLFTGQVAEGKIDPCMWRK